VPKFLKGIKGRTDLSFINTNKSHKSEDDVIPKKELNRDKSSHLLRRGTYQKGGMDSSISPISPPTSPLTCIDEPQKVSAFSAF